MPNDPHRTISDDRETSIRLHRFVVLFVAVWLTASAGAADEGSDRGFFGLTPRASESGLTVYRVVSDGPAEKAGIEAGDLLIAIGGEPVANLSQAEIPEVFTKFRAGETVDVVYRRGEKLATARVELTRVPPLTLEEQRRIADVERRVRASEVMERILSTGDVIELARTETGEVRYRPDAETDWEVLDAYVGEKFEPALERYRRDGRKIVRLRIHRSEDGEVEELTFIE